MATTGTVTTYTHTTGVMLDFEPMIHLLDPFDTPILGGVAADGGGLISQGPCFEKKVEWQDESLLTPRTALAATAVTADTVITVVAGERERFQTDDLVLIDGETLRITGYGTTADTLLINPRATATWAGSAAQHANASVIIGVGSALPEGSDPPTARSRDRTARYNLTETFGPVAIQVSGSEQAVRKYGLVGTEFDHQSANRFKEIAVGVEQAIIYGARVEDTATGRRSMGGFNYYITTNIDSSTTTLTETKLLDAMQVTFDAGGNPNRVSGGSKAKRTISGFTSAATISIDRPDRTRGVIVDTFISDFGMATIILDRWYRVSDLHVWNGDQVSLETLRPIHYEPLAKSGDSDKGQIVGEKTLRFRREKHAYRFSALT